MFCDLVIVHRYESRTTKSTELNFSALLSEDGARNMRFERALRTNAIQGAVYLCGSLTPCDHLLDA